MFFVKRDYLFNLSICRFISDKLVFLENKIKKAGKTIQGNAKIGDNLLEYLDFEAASYIVDTYNTVDDFIFKSASF